MQEWINLLLADGPLLGQRLSVVVEALCMSLVLSALLSVIFGAMIRSPYERVVQGLFTPICQRLNRSDRGAMALRSRGSFVALMVVVIVCVYGTRYSVVFLPKIQNSLLLLGFCHSYYILSLREVIGLPCSHLCLFCNG